MCGGLVQIIQTGAEDIYLTGNPQITFFKSVYRKHTAFAFESFHVPLLMDSNVLECVIPVYGDLLSRITLEVLDERNMPNKVPVVETKKSRFFRTWVQANLNLVNQIMQMVQAVNLTYDKLSTLLAKSQYIEDMDNAYANLQALGLTNQEAIYASQVDIRHYIYRWLDDKTMTDAEKKHNMLKFIQDQYWPIITTADEHFDQALINDSITDTQLPIDNVSLSIGGKVINKFTGDYVQIRNQLGLKSGTEDGYNYLINHGTIPIPFWFTGHPSQALPVVALKNQDIEFQAEMTTPVHGRLLVEFIFLGKDERERFISSIHEYLIPVIQTSIELTNPTKAHKFEPEFRFTTRTVYWYAKSNGRYLPINRSTISVNNKVLGVPYQSGLYFSQLVPNQYFPHDGPENVNVITWALSPYDLQPSGSINMSSIDRFTIACELDNMPADIVEWGIIADSWNVLRIAGGLAELAFH